MGEATKPFRIGASRGPGGFAIAVAGSVIVHVALAACFLPVTRQFPGMGGQERYAIGVELVATSTLESLMAPPEHTALARAPPPVPSDVPPHLPSDMPPHMPIGTMPTAAVTMSDRSATAVGAATFSATTDAMDDARGSASPGQIARYAMEVRAAVGLGRPRHLGVRGRVEIAFGLTSAGSVRFAGIANSSGNSRLDAAGLRVIHVARFPKPPPGMTDDQRSYAVPFDFK